MTEKLEDLVTRLRKRAEIRRNIPTRKSVQNQEPDRIADLLEEAATEIERVRGWGNHLNRILGLPSPCHTTDCEHMADLKKDFEAHEVKEVQYHDTIHKLEMEIEALKNPNWSCFFGFHNWEWSKPTMESTKWVHPTKGTEQCLTREMVRYRTCLVCGDTSRRIL